MTVTRVHGRTIPTAGVLLLISAVAPMTACSGKLSKEKAKGILMDKVYNGPAECSVRLTKLDETRHTFSENDRATMECSAQLEAAKLMQRGECLSKLSSGECLTLVVTPVAPATIKYSQLTFPCGKFEGVEVTSVTTEDKKATVKVSRNFVLDTALLAKVSSCKVDKPNVGQGEITKTFTKDDDGNWQLKD